MSRNLKPEECKGLVKVTSREGRVSRNEQINNEAERKEVTSREGRVSRNKQSAEKSESALKSRPARDV